MADARVVHVISGLGVGGAEHYLRRLVLAERDAGGAEHVVISLTTIGEVGRMLQEAGIRVEALGMRSSFGVPAALVQLRRRLAALRPTIVQGWMYHGDLLGGLAARWARVGRVVWNIRTSALAESAPRTTRVARWLCARLSRRLPDAIVCAAEAARRSHVAIGYHPDKMRVIPNGFVITDDAALVHDDLSLRDLLGWNANDLVVGLVARFHAIKGVDHFVQAAGRLRERLPKVRFLMVGRDIDPENAALSQWIDAYGLREHVAMLGERDDVRRCFSAMTVFVLSSRAEGFPNVVGEAMEAGVPCVATDVGDAAQLLGGTGRIVPPNDPGALADGIAELLALSPAERCALGMQARARIRTQFSMAQSYARYNALYAELLDEPNARTRA